MRVKETLMKLYLHPAVKMPLYSHQCSLLDEWEHNDAFILATKTGSGKTGAATFPIIFHKESAVFVYPTNALIADQESSILSLMKQEGISVRVLSPSNIIEKYGDEDYHLLRIDAERLEEYRIALKLKDKGSALLRLIQPSRPKILLINPNLLYLIFSLKYGRASAELISHFEAYKTVVFDEFHLYAGVELAHVLFLIFLVREFGGFSRVVLLSATPTPEVLVLLNKLLGEPPLIDSNVITIHTCVGDRIATFPLTFECLNSGPDEVVVCFSYLQKKREELEAARKANSNEEFIPGVVILNSVVSAIRLEDLLVKAGWETGKIGVVRGLMSKKERQVGGQVVIIGTSAIEVGIDFKAGMLLFEAGDAASFLQRIGRVGRHGPGSAVLFGNSREEAAFQSLNDEVTRDLLESTVNKIYKERSSFAWFPSTFSGALTMIAQTESISRRVEEDQKCNEMIKAELRNWLDNVTNKFASIMGLERNLKLARRRVIAVRQGGSTGQWITEYIGEVAFRSSVPTVHIYDWAEKKRGRAPEYEADLITLLKWGIRSPRYIEKTDKICIDGFQNGKPHKIYLSETFEDEEVGIILTTSDYQSLKVLQDGHLTSISHLFTVRPHIFVLIPLDFARRLDWRLPWFRCGSQGNKAAVFDGGALVVWELWKQLQA